jgi:hypothetical protein
MMLELISTADEPIKKLHVGQVLLIERIIR